MDKAVVEFSQKLILLSNRKPVQFNEQEAEWLHQFRWFRGESGLEPDDVLAVFTEILNRVACHGKASHGGYLRTALRNAVIKLATNAKKRRRRKDQADASEKAWKAATSRRDMRLDFASAISKIEPGLGSLLQDRINNVTLEAMAKKYGVDEKEIRRRIETAKDAIRPHLRAGYGDIGLPAKNSVS